MSLAPKNSRRQETYRRHVRLTANTPSSPSKSPTPPPILPFLESELPALDPCSPRRSPADIKNTSILSPKRRSPLLKQKPSRPLLGCRLNPNYRSPTPPPPKISSFPAKSLLYVANVPDNTEKSKIRALFEPFGTVAEIRISRNFAFVQFLSADAAAAALALNRTEQFAEGNLIDVEYSNDKVRQARRANDECFHCHQPGHWARHCPRKRTASREDAWTHASRHVETRSVLRPLPPRDYDPYTYSASNPRGPVMQYDAYRREYTPELRDYETRYEPYRDRWDNAYPYRRYEPYAEPGYSHRYGQYGPPGGESSYHPHQRLRERYYREY